MSTFVDECRREWRRLGVPDLLAGEMASDLEADLAEAQAEGVSAEELLGGSDPQRLAADWAEERGLVSEPKQQPSRRGRMWIGLAATLAVVFATIMLALFGLAAGVTVHSTSNPPSLAPPHLFGVIVPRFVGLSERQAARKARSIGLRVRVHVSHPGRVVAQVPAVGLRVRRGSIVRLRIGRGS